MTQPLLVLNVAFGAVRGFLVLPDGSRLAVRNLDEEAESDELQPAIFIDELGAEIGSRAQRASASGVSGLFWHVDLRNIDQTGFEAQRVWRRHYLLAVILQRCLVVASRCAAQPVNALLLVVPPGLDRAQTTLVKTAGHLAGACQVELVDLLTLSTEGVEGELDKSHILIEFDEHRLVISSLSRKGGSDWSARTTDISATLAGSCLLDSLLEASDDYAEPAIVRSLLEAEMSDWSEKPIFISSPAKSGPPATLFVASRDRLSMREHILEQIRAAALVGGNSLESIASVHVVGTWGGALLQPLQQIFSTAIVRSFHDPSEFLEHLRPSVPPPAYTSTEISAAPARQGAGSERVALMRRDEKLPAFETREDFPVQPFLGQIELLAAPPDGRGASQSIASIPFPRLFERRRFIQLKIAVIADTDDVLIARLELGSRANSSLVVWDWQSSTADIPPETVIAQLLEDRIARFRPTNPVLQFA